LKKLGIPMPKLLDVDVDQELILKEYIEGDTIFNLVLTNRMNPQYLDQITKICTILYPKKINIDYFPTNFVVNQNLLYYVDYECNEYMDEWNFENWGKNYWSKTPEFLFYVSKELSKK
jgi:tRNA A-37 threonylcarbamoyl transferase component Bud32